VHVGNIARSGVGARALDQVLERVLPRYPRLQMIIILVGASDVLQWLEHGAPAERPSTAKNLGDFPLSPELTFGWRPRWAGYGGTACAGFGSVGFVRQAHPNACRWIGKARRMARRSPKLRTDMPDPTPMLAHFDCYFRSAIRRAMAHADRVHRCPSALVRQAL
jgi:hypothetical protein